MVEGARPGLTLPEATQAGDQCNKMARRTSPSRRCAWSAARAISTSSALAPSPSSSPKSAARTARLNASRHALTPIMVEAAGANAFPPRVTALKGGRA